jgi:spore germination cell wall hydrolase CwlJ-like protein
MLVEAVICIATAVYFEARAEPLEGQQAVAYVILNRAEDPYYPNDICEVVKQKNQFSFYWDGVSDVPKEKWAYQKAVRVAVEAIHYSWANPVPRATHYHAKRVRPVWRHKLQKMRTIGNHVFYKRKNEKHW